MMSNSHGGWRRLLVVAAGLVVTAALSSTLSFSASPATPILISQTPLTVAIPAHPQIVFALANSQSMDGNLSGAVMTGSGSLGGALAAGLAGSSSPVNFSIPAGFTPPVNPGASGQAPYTVNVSGTLVDNSPSRLNVAKAGINAILNSFMEYADFALMDYSTGNLGEYATWVYYMSADPSGFSFTSTPGASDYVANPCYMADTTQPDAYSQSCAALLANYGSASGVISQPYMLIGASSDDPLINDVFYAQVGYEPPVCTDAVPNPLNPYTSFGLANYESGSVTEFFGVQWGLAGYSWSCAPGMAPTNAGYVPYSAQVMHAMRGFGYDATSQSAVTGNLLVPMQSSGDSPTPASVAAAIAAFTPYTQPETSDPSTTEIKSVAEQSPLAGLVKGAAQYFSTTNPSSSNACAPARYIVLLTDGLPTKDLSGNNWPPLGTAAASGYGVTASFNANGSLAATNDQALADTIAQINAAAADGIKTYIIGLGAGVDPANNPMAASTLTAMAVAGGTGNYFAANSPAALSTDMQVILARILAAVRSTSSATVNTTGLNSTSMAFQPSFNTSDIDQDWTGDIKAYPINPGTGTVDTSTLSWSAQTQLDSQASGNGWGNRLIATWDPVVQAGIPFEWNTGTPSSGIAVSTTLGQALETNPADPSGQDALDYLRGDAQLSIANGGAYRNRTHILGDIVDSAPVYVGAAVGPYQSSSYYSFEQNYANRSPVLYVGANDGMLHAISATTGQELFAYVPNGVFSNLINLTNPYYNEDHQFFVDGSPQVADVQFNDISHSWHTILVSGERAGGNTIFALDVTDPSSMTTESAVASKVLWEFSDTNMGLSFSTPAIAQTAAGATSSNLGFTVFFGNGYNSPSQTPYLYAVDPQTGASLPGTPINLCAAVASACNTSQPNGLASVNVINNHGGIGTPATTVYAGDLQGNLWRVDIRDPDPRNWVVSLLFKATDPSGTPQPITTTPAVSLNPEFPRLAGTMVYVGTGQLLSATDLNSTQVQTMYGVYDSGSNASTLTRADLVQQTMTASVVSGHTLRFVSGTQIALPSQNGWYVDFTLLSGERIVSDPRLVGGALTVISVQPAPYTSSSSMNLSSHSHANLAQSTAPPAQAPMAAPLTTATLDSVVYLNDDTGRGIAQGAAPQARGQDGIYYPSGSTAQLLPVGLGVSPPPTLVSIAVTPANPTITQGQTEEFTATGTYSDGSTQNLTSQVSWSSSDTGVATVGGSGLASSLSAGTTGIMATLGGVSGSTTLTVLAPPPPPPPPTLVSITVTPANPTVDVGSTQPFVATGTYSDGSTLNITAQVTWSSSDTGVASISSGGLASAIAVGSSTITATLSGVSGSTTMTVVTPPPPPPPPTLVSITVTPANPTIYVGQTKQFHATAHYSDGSTQNVTGTATWTSSTTTVATIAAGGLATSSTAGSTTITATLSGISGSTTLTVINRPPPPTLVSITVTPANPTIYVGQTAQFVATGYYSDGSTQNLSTVVSWTSGTTSVATIASAGLATSYAAGTSTITATDGAISGSTTLNVITRPPPPTLLSISVTPANPTIDVGQSEAFTATGHYSDGSTQNLTSVATWSSSNLGVATMGSGGLANSIAIGTTTIIAADGSVSGGTTLTVVTTPPPPPPPVCPGGDVSYLMEFNFAGGAFTVPVFNYNGSGAVTSSIIPANGLLLGGVYASAPVFNTYGAGTYGNGGLVGLVTLSNGTIASFFQLGLHQQRYSWWEVR